MEIEEKCNKKLFIGEKAHCENFRNRWFALFQFVHNSSHSPNRFSLPLYYRWLRLFQWPPFLPLPSPWYSLCSKTSFRLASFTARLKQTNDENKKKFIHWNKTHPMMKMNARNCWKCIAHLVFLLFIIFSCSRTLVIQLRFIFVSIRLFFSDRLKMILSILLQFNTQNDDIQHPTNQVPIYILRLRWWCIFCLRSFVSYIHGQQYLVTISCNWHTRTHTRAHSERPPPPTLTTTTLAFRTVMRFVVTV